MTVIETGTIKRGYDVGLFGLSGDISGQKYKVVYSIDTTAATFLTNSQASGGSSYGGGPMGTATVYMGRGSYTITGEFGGGVSQYKGRIAPGMADVGTTFNVVQSIYDETNSPFTSGPFPGDIFSSGTFTVSSPDKVSSSIIDLQSSLGDYVASDTSPLQYIFNEPDAPLSLDGGTRILPAFIDSPGATGIQTTFDGRASTEKFYEFGWNGGNFSASASLSNFDGNYDPLPTDSFVFELINMHGTVIGSADLSASNAFAAQLKFPNSPTYFANEYSEVLSAGNYKIGIFSTSGIDPTLNISFGSPVGIASAAVPEEAAWETMILGFLAIGTVARRQRRLQIQLPASDI